MALTDVAPHRLTSNTTPSPYEAKSSSEYSSSYSAWKAFEGNPDTNGFWAAAIGTSTGWLQIRLTKQETVTSYGLVHSEANRLPKDFTLQGSNSGSSWDILDRRSNISGWSATPRIFQVQNPGSYLYYRINITANNGDGLVAIGEVYLYASALSLTPKGLVGKRFLGTEDLTVFPPRVDAGPDQYVTFQNSLTDPLTVTLAGSSPDTVTYLWTKVWGPGTATFTDDTDPTTDVEFSVAGAYRLRLTVDDGTNTNYRDVTFNVDTDVNQISQVVVEVLDGTSSATNLAQVVTEVLDGTSSSTDIAQVVVETLWAWRDIAIPHLSSGAVLFAPTLSCDQTLVLPFLDTGAVVYAPTNLEVEELEIFEIILPFLSSGSVLYAPSVSTGPPTQNLILPFLSSGSVVYAPAWIGWIDEQIAQVVVEVIEQFNAGIDEAQLVVEVIHQPTASEDIGQLVVEVIFPAPHIPEVTFYSDVLGLLIWIEWSHINETGDTTYVYSQIPLADAMSYYGGWKESRVVTWGKFRRALSDRLGQYEVASLSWTLSDTDRFLRGMLADPIMRYFQNRQVAMRMIDDAGRRREDVPRLVARGIIRRCKPVSPLLVEFTAEDFLSSTFSNMNFAKQVPQRTFEAIDFPDIPKASVGLPVPILYGELSDERSAEAIVTGVVAESATYGSPVQNVVLTPTSGGTCVELPLTPGGSDYVATLAYVTAYDTDGVEYDPDTWPPQDAQLTPGYTALRYDWDTWTPPGGKTLGGYRVYYRNYWHEAKYVEVAAGTTTYTLTSFETGTIVQGGGYTYRVSAMCSDGETVWSDAAYGSAPAKKIPTGMEVTWDDHAAVIGNYYVYRMINSGPGADANRQWSTLVPDPETGTVTFHDDFLDTGATIISGVAMPSGVVTPVYVGTTKYDGPEVDPAETDMTWWVFALAGHAVKEIINIYQLDDITDTIVKVPDDSYHTTWCAPGRDDAWGGTFPNYMDRGSGDAIHRYALIYVRGPEGDHAADGTRPFRVNLKGIEQAGDGSGALISNLHDQYLHACQNWLFQSYLTGAWLATPHWEADVMGVVSNQIDETSFVTVKATVAASRLTTGYVGAWALGLGGEQQTLRDVLALLNVNADVNSGFNRNSQFFITMLDPDTDLSDPDIEHFRQATDVVAESFEIEDLVDELYNRLPFSYKRNYAAGTWDIEDVHEDADSITNYRETRSDALLELWCVRDVATAESIATSRIHRTRDAPRMVRFLTNLRGLNVELGDVITIDHIEGIGTTGWEGWPLRVIRHEFDPENLAVWLECTDVNRELRQRTTGATIASATVMTTPTVTQP